MQVYDTHEDDENDYGNPPWTTVIAAAFIAFSVAALTAWGLTEAVKWAVAP